VARIRTIKPEFFRSRSLARCSIAARHTFIGMWCEADDFGRGVADARLIKGSIWPLDDDIDVTAVEGHLAELEDTGHVLIYLQGVDKFYVIHSWERHQASAYRRGEAVHPEPPSDQDIQSSHDETCKKVRDARPIVLEGKGREGKGREGSVREKPRTTPRRGCSLPLDFTLTDEMRKWAAAKGITSDPDYETEKFIDHFAATNVTKVDWVRTWQNWMRRADEGWGRPAGGPKRETREWE
jgi:hypothetical protein